MGQEEAHRQSGTDTEEGNEIETSTFVRNTKACQDFDIHRSLLCHYSSYFQAAFREGSRGFREAESGVVVLPDEDVGVFQAVYDWLHTHHLPYDDHETKVAIPSMQDAQDKLYFLARVWIFGDMRGMPQLQDAVTNQMICLWTSWNAGVPGSEFASCVYDRTSAKSKLRKLLVDMTVYSNPRYIIILHPTAARFSEAGFLQGWPEDYYEDLLLENMIAFGDIAPPQKRLANVWKEMRCLYHVHGYDKT